MVVVHFLRAVIVMAVFIVTLGVAVLGLFISLALYPFSKTAWIATNSWITAKWISMIRGVAEYVMRVRFVITGQIWRAENALVISNHQGANDIIVSYWFADALGMGGAISYFVKKDLIKLPIVGQALWLRNCIFIDRDWMKDQATIEAAFHHATSLDLPLCLNLYPEGTRKTPEKLKNSKTFQWNQGLNRTEHVMAPRAKGFVATINGLGSHIKSVYDLTIAYPDNRVGLVDFLMGRVPEIHVDIRRYPTEDLREMSEDEIGDWLVTQFQRKEALLDYFESKKEFPKTLC